MEDILRKRLLGWVDPPPTPEQPVSPPKPTADRSHESQKSETPLAATEALVEQNNGPSFNKSNNTGEQSGESQHNNDNSREEINNNESGERRYNTLSYANTSVLKHLLYRYTGTPQ